MLTLRRVAVYGSRCLDSKQNSVWRPTPCQTPPGAPNEVAFAQVSDRLVLCRCPLAVSATLGAELDCFIAWISSVRTVYGALQRESFFFLCTRKPECMLISSRPVTLMLFAPVQASCTSLPLKGQSFRRQGKHIARSRRMLRPRALVPSSHC